MFTKLISFVCVLTLALAATSYGAYGTYTGDFLIGNWEGCFDHWSVDRGDDVMLGFSKTGATLNGPAGVYEGGHADAWALKFVAPNGNWTSAITLKLQGYSNEDLDIFGTQTDVVAWFAGNCIYDMLEIDVTRIASEWTAIDVDPTSELVFIFNWGVGATTGWNMIGPGNSAWDPSMGDDPIHCVYDMTPYKKEFADAYDADPTAEVYCEILLFAWTAAYDNPVTYYLDAAYLTPEPATIALLGLGGLSLLRIRRKR